jgi:hypothetical protein
LAHQRGNGRGTQRADPLQLLRGQILANARLGNHAAVAHQHHALEPEAVAQLGDLAGQGRGVPGIALEHLHGHRTALHVGEQAKHDLGPIGPAVARVSPLRQGAAAPLEIGRAHIVEHQRSGAEVALGQGGLHRRLAQQQPVHRGIQIVLIHAQG